jgi:hypothetical protein
MTDSVDGSILYSLYYHTGGDLFGLGSGTSAFDLWNPDSPLMQQMLVAFTPYAYGSDTLVNMVDPSVFPKDKMTEAQRGAIDKAYYNKWWKSSDADHTTDTNPLLFGFFPWDAQVVKDVNNNDVFACSISDNTVLRYCDPLSGAPLWMKIQTLGLMAGAGLIGYFGYRELKAKNVI